MTTLAELVAERRDQLGLTSIDVYRLGGPTPGTQAQILAGHIPGKGATRALEWVLGWRSGAISEFRLRGTVPDVVAEPDFGPLRSRRGGIVDHPDPEQVRQILTPPPPVHVQDGAVRIEVPAEALEGLGTLEVAEILAVARGAALARAREIRKHREWVIPPLA